MLRRGDLSPVELADAALERIERLDPGLNAFLTVVPEDARAAAKRAEAEIIAGAYRGPLHGVPIAHKDVLATRGVRTTAHSRVLAEHVPDADATVVARLARRGATLLGKLNTYEFACGATESFGVPVNPWDATRTTGGSSAGSGAAVAAGLCLGATGTDTGGSIRSPASYCGVVGLKPTYGLVSRAGVLSVSWSLDHVGPLTRSVGDAALMLAAMAGPDPADPSSRDRPGSALDPDAVERAALDLRGLRVGVPWALFGPPVVPEVRSVVEEAVRVLERLGVTIVAVDLPFVSLTGASLQGVMAPEATLAHLGRLREGAARYAPFTRQKLLLGACLDGMAYLRAQQARHAVTAGLEEVLRSVDALVWPTTSRAAPRLDEPEVPTGVQTRLTNLTGHPSLSVPCGFTPSGLPVGMQLVGRRFDEATLLRVGVAYERATAWSDRRPDPAGFPAPPAGKPYAIPGVPEGVSKREREALETDVVRALRRWDLPLLEEDLAPLVAGLHAFRADLRALDHTPWARFEPLVHQHVTALPHP